MISINKTLYKNYLRVASEISGCRAQQPVLPLTNKTPAPAAKPDASKHETQKRADASKQQQNRKRSAHTPPHTSHPTKNIPGHRHQAKTPSK